LLSPVWATKAATSSGEKRLAAENTAPGSRGPAGAAAAAADPLAALPAAPANPLQPDTADAALPRHPPGPASSRDSCSAALWRVIGTAFQAGRRPRTSAPQPNTRNDGVLRSAEARALHMATGHTCSPAQPARHSKHAHHVWDRALLCPLHCISRTLGDLPPRPAQGRSNCDWTGSAERSFRYGRRLIAGMLSCLRRRSLWCGVRGCNQ
jgi:hypothetical protein